MTAVLDAELLGGGSAIAAYSGAAARLQRRFAGTVERYAQKTVSVIREQYRSAEATSSTATRLGGGVLAAAYGQRTTEVPGGAQADIGLIRGIASEEALRWGHVHERGATIRPRTAQYLAIPVGDARVSGQRLSPRSFPNTFVIQGTRGPVIMQRGAKGQRARPIFALRREVTVPARPEGGAINAAFEQVLPALSAELADDAASVVSGT